MSEDDRVWAALVAAFKRIEHREVPLNPILGLSGLSLLSEDAFRLLALLDNDKLLDVIGHLALVVGRRSNT